MTDYEKAVRQFRIRYLLHIVVEHRGNILRASRSSGIHRNTFSRMLQAGGIELNELRRDLKTGRYSEQLEAVMHESM
jgi:hypothetical protein